MNVRRKGSGRSYQEERKCIPAGIGVLVLLPIGTSGLIPYIRERSLRSQHRWMSISLRRLLRGLRLGVRPFGNVPCGH